MPHTGKKRTGAPTLGVFVPCDPRIDEGSRTRAFNIGQMTAASAGQAPAPSGRHRSQYLHLLQARRQRARGRRRGPGDARGRGWGHHHDPRHLVLPREDGHGPDRALPSDDPPGLRRRQQRPQARRRRHRRARRRLCSDGPPLPDGHRQHARDRAPPGV